MAGVEYDGIAGVLRVLQAGEQPETFAIEVITFHAAIESEIELVLARTIPRADLLFTGNPRFNFGHKAKLLQATWKGRPEDADKLAKVLHAFQNLRDAVAHSESKGIKSCNTNLTVAYRQLFNEENDDFPIIEVAQGICLFLSDGGISPTRLKETFQALAKFMNDDLPRALGAPKP